MKRFLLVSLVFVSLPCLQVHGQGFPVFDGIVNSTMTASGLSQVIHYAQMVAYNVEQIDQFYQMIEQFKEQAERTVQNLKSFKDIRKWDDFMDWYNRELYLERMTEEMFSDMKISIGKKQYHITDIEGMAYGVNDTYIEYWNKEFTEEQEREMWLKLGLTPTC